MWLTFLRAKQQGLPGFWFEFSPQALRWGCGWYQTEPATMPPSASSYSAATLPGAPR